MEIDIFGFQFGKKKPTQIEKENDALQSFTAPEVFDGTVTVEAGGFFGTALDYASTMRDEGQSIIQYRNMSVYPELDNAIDEIVNASIVPGTDHKPVKLDLTNCPISDNIKNKIYKEFETIIHLLDFNHKSYEIYRRWYIDSKLYYNLIIDKDLPGEGIQNIVPIDPLKIKKVRKVRKEMDRSMAGSTPVQMIKEIEEFFVYTNNDKESYIMTGPQGLHLSHSLIATKRSG